MTRATLGALAGALVLGLVGCGKDDKAAEGAAKDQAFQAEHGAALSAKGKALARIVEDARKRDSLRAPAPAGAARLDFGPARSGGNAEALNLESLTDQKPPVFLAYQTGHGVRALRDLAAGRSPLRSSLEEAVPLDYLLVVRQPEYVDPVQQTGSLFTFRAGRVAGDALLYDLRTGDFLGGVPYEATSSEAVKGSMEDSAPALRADLSRRAEQAIAAAVAALAKEVRPPSR